MPLPQVASPRLLFDHPATASTAEFLGAENVFAGSSRSLGGGADGKTTLYFESAGLRLVVVGVRPSESCHAVIRGEDVVLARAMPVTDSMGNSLQGVIAEVASVGALSRVTVDVAGTLIVATVARSVVGALALARGAPIVACIDATAIHLC